MYCQHVSEYYIAYMQSYWYVYVNLGSPTPRSDVRHWRTASWSWLQQIGGVKKQRNEFSLNELNVAVHSLAMQWFHLSSLSNSMPSIPNVHVSYKASRSQNHVSSHLSDSVCVGTLQFNWHVWHFYHESSSHLVTSICFIHMLLYPACQRQPSRHPVR